MIYARTYRRLIKHIIFAFLVAMSLLMILYFLVFHGRFSKDSSDWANLGAYIGGLLTPLISFAALIAIVVTISIQKQLLNVQQDEFDKLLAANKRQLQISEANFKKNVLVSYKSALITALEQKMALLQSHREQADMGIQLALTANTATSHIGGRAAAAYLSAQKKVKVLEKIQKLDAFILEFTLREHTSTEEIKNDLRQNLEELMEDLTSTNDGEGI